MRWGSIANPLQGGFFVAAAHRSERSVVTGKERRKVAVQNYIWIMIGSALGGGARYWCSGFAASRIGETFPWGTLMVNVIGSFVIGFFATLTLPDVDARSRRRPTRSTRSAPRE